MATNYEAEKQYVAAEREAQRQADLALFFRVQKPSFHPVSFFVRSDVVVLRRDPEYAEIGNPEGNVYGESFYMVAEDAKGYRKAWAPAHLCRTQEEVERAFEFLAPAVSEWGDCQPCYGSEAYETEGCELDQLEEEMYEDLGPNWRTDAPEVAFAISARRG